tara:strand:+ start:154 stop:657 length:504 start_codon:yes stop_codon:yes gene_type:complete
MKLGKINILFFIFFLNSSICLTQDKIISSPLINLDKIKPSFEELEDNNNEISDIEKIKDKKEVIDQNKQPSAILIGLDKITAKTSKIKINLGESKKFGLLEIKVLKCGKIKSQSMDDNAAYLQVKDLSQNQDEKVFIFNGWTFSSNPSLTPFDHAIYDIQLVNCRNV